MINDGLQISMDGQWDIVGKDFYNPRTGAHIRVRDVFNDGSQFQIRGDDDTLIEMNEFSEYVQSDVPLGKLPPAPKVKLGDLGDPTIEPIDNIYEKALEEESILNNPIQPQISTPQNSPKDAPRPSAQPDPVSQNVFIMEKALSKCEKPTINITYEFAENDNSTAKAISVLRDVMDISEEEIAEYYFNKFIKETLENVAKEAFDAKFATF